MTEKWEDSPEYQRAWEAYQRHFFDNENHDPHGFYQSKEFRDARARFNQRLNDDTPRHQ